MTKNWTAEWYKLGGWRAINKVLLELAAKDVETAFISNFEILPENLNKDILAEIFNEDSSAWRMKTDEEGNLVCYKRNIRKQKPCSS